MLAAARIMLASPNSVEEIPAIWPWGKDESPRRRLSKESKRTEDVKPSHYPPNLRKA